MTTPARNNKFAATAATLCSSLLLCMPVAFAETTPGAAVGTGTSAAAAASAGSDTTHLTAPPWPAAPTSGPSGASSNIYGSEAQSDEVKDLVETMPYNAGAEAQSAAAINSGQGQASGVPFVWANPAARSTDPSQGVELSIKEISPRTLTAGQNRIEFTLRVTNNRAEALNQASLRLYHRPPAGSATEIHTSLLANHGEYPSTSELVEINERIEPGETHQIRVAVQAPERGSRGADSRDSRDNADEGRRGAGAYVISSPLVGQPGTHPVLFSFSGSTDDDGSTSADAVQLLAVARTTVTVKADPATDRADREDGEEATERADATPTPTTLVWPLAAPTRLTPGATGNAPERAPLHLLNEDLADELGGGGRLRGLLDSYIAATRDNADLKAATCLAIDPELLDTVDRMAGGYEVGQEPPGKAPEQKRLRDSWGNFFNNDDSDYLPGRGAEDAARWLEDLHAVVADSCIVALPYAGADLNSLAMLNEQADWLAVQALGIGPAIIRRILGVLPLQDVVIPTAGYVAPEAQRLLLGGSWSTEGRDATPAGGHARPGAAPTPSNTEGREGADEQPAHPSAQHNSDAVGQDAPATKAADLAGDSSLRFEAIQQGAPTLPPTGHVTALVAETSVARESITEPNPSESAESDSDGTDSDTAARKARDGAHAAERNNRLVRLDERTTALAYSPELADSLRATGVRPEIAAFTDPQRRYDLDADSSAARMGNTLAVLEQEIGSGKPVLAVPPANWSVTGEDASALLDAFAGYLADGRAEAVSLAEAVHPDERAGIAEGSLTLPYEDPGAISDEFAGAVRATAGEINELTLFMRNDPQIALSRETFTHPLLLDALRAFSSYEVRSRPLWSSVRTDNAIRAMHMRQVEQGLRRSVNLVPPGSVFTRTSESSPLIVVARNGLPLPVRAEIAYSAGLEGLTVSVPDSQLIPALGSMTVSLTTQFSGQEARLRMWLATPDDRPISESVELQVQSVPGMSKGGLLVTVVLLAGIGLAGKKLWDRRHGGIRRQRASALKRLELDNRES